MAVTNHSPTPEEVMAFLDGEALHGDRERIQAHIDACEGCRALVDDLRSVSRNVAAWQVEDVPETLRPRDPMPVVVPARRWFSQPWQVGLATAAGLTLIAYVFVPVTSQSKRARVTAMGAEADASASARVGPGQAKDSDVAYRSRVPADNPMSAPQKQAMNAESTESFAAVQQPMLIRTASLSLVARDFPVVRPTVERIVRELGGFIDQMTATGTEGTPRSLTGTLRIPAARLDEALARLRQLGQVTEDNQGSEDVADQVIDLDARLASSRATEKRLADILREKTGRLSDVLEVERELTRVRFEIERLDAQRANIGRRVTYAAVTIAIAEERKASLGGPLSLGSRLRVAFADGMETARESVIGIVLFVLRAGPALAIWLIAAALVWFGVRGVRGMRRV